MIRSEVTVGLLHSFMVHYVALARCLGADWKEIPKMHKADFPAELKGFHHIWMYLIREEVDSLQVSTWFDDLHRAWGYGAGAGKGSFWEEPGGQRHQGLRGQHDDPQPHPP